MSTQIKGYFQILDGQIAIVLKDFWEKNYILDDEPDFDNLLPPQFFSICESIYEHTYESDEKAIEALNQYSWEEKELL
jgi:hypothetical protein